MPSADFDDLTARLMRAGVASRIVRRAVTELQAHYDDLVDEATARGMSRSEAESLAADRLGSADDLVAGFERQPELQTWTRRNPRLALVCLPLACAVLLPVSPLMRGRAYAPVVARWGACLLLSGAVTAAMLLAMQLTLVLT